MHYKERDVAKDFAAIFADYLCLSPKSFSDPGWSDRLIVLPDARVVACELKRIRLTLNNTYNLKELRNDQTAWLAKWQKAGGLCFVLAGFYRLASVRKNAITKFVSLAPITVAHWKDWLAISHTEFVYDDLLPLATDDNNAIYDWFINYTNEHSMRTANVLPMRQERVYA